MFADVTDNTTELLSLVASGNEKAYRKLFHLYADLLHTYIQHLTKSNELAEEIVQDIFLQIWTTRETLGNIHNFRNYLFVISRNHALNIIKKMVREHKKRKLWEYNEELLTTHPPENQERQLSLIEEAIAQLPPQQQKVWIMSRQQGMKYNEIATATGLSRETVKKYLQYGTQSIINYVTKHKDLLLILLLFIKKKFPT